MGLPVTLEGKTVEIFKPHTTKRHMLGTRLAFPDGRVYRYAKAGAANITIGRVCGMAAATATLNSDCVCSGVAAQSTADWDNGEHYTYVATTASATTSLHVYANRFDDGYLWVNDVDGEGQMLQIKEHGVSTSTASTAVKITCYDEDILTIALTTGSQMGLVPNVYRDIVIHTGTTGAGPALGVAPVAVTAAYYFWLQTWGPCPVMNGATASLRGEPMAVVNDTGGDTGATGVAGSVYPPDAVQFDGNTGLSDIKWAGAPLVGWTMVPASGDAEYALVFLTISP
jgi:hypothetical protein